MLASRIDHLVITAPTLAQGTQYLSQALGVSPQTGGAHPRMGTHNCVLRLGPDLYAEVIATAPDAAAPARPRWFQLDDTLWNDRPRLATWVVRTSDIRAAQAAARIPNGEIHAMTRGELEWLITITEDGSLPMQGAVPAFIQWSASQHPAALMRDMGCALIGLESHHPEAPAIDGMLRRIGFEGSFSAHAVPAGTQPYLIAHIQTPGGPRQLGNIGGR
jgi:hypothetical protein